MVVRLLAVAVVPYDCSPSEDESTVAALRFTPTDPSVTDAALLVRPVASRPPPMNTESDLAKVPPCIHADGLRLAVDFAQHALEFAVQHAAGSPVKVPEADCVAKVRARSSSCEMLLMPPSMICNVARPSLAF